MSETAGQRRYTIRAGRYLCDKEFRYLRTVRVTAAVYRGFHSKQLTLLLPTFQHRAGVRLYTSCYHLAESCVFNKQSLPPGMCRFPNQKIGEHPFSRSYGVILPSSFDMVLSSALVYSTCSPVSVWGTVSSPGGSPLPIRSFFLEVSTLLTMTRVANIKRLVTMAGRERRVRGRGGSPRPDHPIRSKRQAWFCSQSNFVTFVYPSDGSPFGGSLGTDSLRRLTERRKPSTGRRSCFSQDFSFMSAFSLLISPGLVTKNLPRLTERSATDT
ncbi:UNVERIFIED_CONTAM: hypothetical protein Scaly_2652300 [Sesamum calycinum]|uniref:Uncharacterized protein n=1 Tax=Sesamum calycinum TaxID=2727403 RepID=A0AAW2JAQ5_9LAMI